ncbi:hypothetical protein HD553DRAFT_327296 [Filobasidium floriforme]|uniref:uncharacterized protein n=1 Tax=Filobasidium floriforme TaxID=5210 RepID=UPI001E8CF267|nr:uncharacterized protein HD553DRAFT_327296 [Filobasidium floriforme]KAH8077477.1 hypothetical protein HD553DRAFT_327296 [Filobasidium floriforme]
MPLDWDGTVPLKELFSSALRIAQRIERESSQWSTSTKDGGRIVKNNERKKIHASVSQAYAQHEPSSPKAYLTEHQLDQAYHDSQYTAEDIEKFLGEMLDLELDPRDPQDREDWLQLLAHFSEGDVESRSTKWNGTRYGRSMWRLYHQVRFVWDRDFDSEEHLDPVEAYRRVLAGFRAWREPPTTNPFLIQDSVISGCEAAESETESLWSDSTSRLDRESSFNASASNPISAFSGTASSHLTRSRSRERTG